VVVSGAPSEEAARDCARSIASSPLVKAALFGADPNWGRVLSTVGARAGAAGYPIDPFKARVVLQGVPVFGGGAPIEFDREGLRARMRETRIDVLVELADGEARAVAWGCDLSYDYVKINADYSSMIVQNPDGGVAKEDRVANYSPAFKRTLLAEALKYIAAFSGQIAVIKYGGAAMVKESLKEAFAEDVTLLKKVGLKPVVVHGGAPEITKTLEKLGERSEFVDGLRVTDAQSLPVVEMVLTGKVNQELVALLNARNAGAVGLSGKDGRLLRARKTVHESGRDLGYVGEVLEVNREFLKMFLDGGYVPVISPIGLTDEGTGLSINADEVASAVAVALGATKLIYLTDVGGVLESAPDGELVRQLTAVDLGRRLEAGAITGGMKWKAHSILAALKGGVGRVHVLDGRQPHTVIAELFTDRGVGSLVTST
jgi:acetylglutamate kinase